MYYFVFIIIHNQWNLFVVDITKTAATVLSIAIDTGIHQHEIVYFHDHMTHCYFVYIYSHDFTI